MVKEAVILAAGEGNRLRPFTEDVPKVMLPVANKPILEYVIESLQQNGIRDIIIVVGYKRESIMGYFGEGSKYGVNIRYVVQEKQLGTGHALLQAKNFVTGDEFVVLPGDNIVDGKTISRLMDSPSPALVIEESDSPSKYGVIEMEENIVKNLTEKPFIAESNIISTGIYKFKKEIFQLIDSCVNEGKNDITDAIQYLIRENKLYGVRGNGKWRDAVYPWDLLKMNEDVLNEIPSNVAGTIEKNVIIKGKVSIGENTIIHSGSYIVGPVIIGEGCEIGPNVCIFPSTSIGNNVTIYPFSEIRDVLIMDDATIGSFSYISKSVIGRGTKIAEHFSTFVGDSLVEIEGEIKKLSGMGVFIGGNCIIESGVIVKGGTIMGKKCYVAANKIINEKVGSGSKVV